MLVQIEENVREADVFVVQPSCHPVSDGLIELLITLDALKHASAGRITAVLPYFPYARSDKKDRPRISITARLMADLIQTAGADRVLTMDLHSPQVQGFFHIPVDDLYALPVLCEAIEQKTFPNLVVVSPDAGFVTKARKFAKRLQAPLAVADKERTDHTEQAEILSIIGDVRYRTALLVDDFVISGGTLVQAAIALKDLGANNVYAAVTHGVFTDSTITALDDSPIELLIATNTVEPRIAETSPKVEVVSVGPLFGEAVRRIHQRESISVLFD